MGKSLFEFSKDQRGIRQEHKEETRQDRKKELDEEEVKRKIKNYSKLSERDLMQELYNEVGKQKASGNFDVNKLKSQFENVKPMLNESQKSNLERILKNLK
jgi:hypothetical protein